MIYVVDTSSIQQMFGCYSRKRFPSLWSRFDELVNNGAITSIRHVKREIENRDKHNGELDWVSRYKELFPNLTADETKFLRDIFAVPRFQHTVPNDIRDENAQADPFLIAKAKAIEGMVVTQERERGNRVRIPSICKYFDIRYGTLDDLMALENWSF